MTQYQKQVVRQLLRQAGYKEQENWWENNDIKSAIMKADLFADDPTSIDSAKIVDELRKLNPFSNPAYHDFYNQGYLNACSKLEEMLNQSK